MEGRSGRPHYDSSLCISEGAATLKNGLQSCPAAQFQGNVHPGRWGETMTTYNDAQHWRDRAKQMRALAEQTAEVAARATMLEIAAKYDHLATRAEDRSRGERPK